MAIPSFTNSAPAKQKSPLVIEEFFELGLEDTASPFLTPESRGWGINLTLKASLLAACLLVISFILSFNSSTLPLSYLLLAAVYFLAGIPSLIESLEDLANLQVNIDVLMTLAAFSSVFIGSGLEGGLLLVLFSLSGSMEETVTAQAKNAISSLHKLSPTKASVVEKDGTLMERSINEIQVANVILIKSGQVVPLDGVVIEGISSVNLVHLTGENFPIRKKEGDVVPAGARNLEGALTVRVTHTSSDSSLARIIQLVTQAQEARPKLQRWFDRFSQVYALTIIILAAFFSLSLPFILGLPFLGVEGSVYRALAFLIAASPCALIIALPMAYLSALSACARRGILLKGGIILDALAKCKTIAFDKTGTLTTGDLSCQSLEGLEGMDPLSADEAREALSIAYALEKNAVHPIAKAILAYAQKAETIPIPLLEFKAIPGYGLEALAVIADGPQKVYIGHADYIFPKLSESVQKALLERAEKIKAAGELLAVLLAGTKIYLFRFRDTPRPEIKEALEALRKRHIKLVMLTGDHAQSAQSIAREMGITDFYANLRPEDKLAHISKIAQTEGLAMVGDGINDAPALARATVGICMGKVGSTAALDAADIILLQDNLEFLDWLIGKACQTQAIVQQNLILALGAILLASLPALAGIVPLWLAVVMHEGGTVLVGLNALRLLRK